MNFEQFGAPVAQAAGTFRSEVDIVLQPDAAPALKIDARLDRDYSTSRTRILGRRGEPGRFMDLEPEPMPQRVAERLGEARGADDLARQGVGLLPRHSGQD